jgi:hypothetical protein
LLIVDPLQNPFFCCSIPFCCWLNWWNRIFVG